MKYQDRKKISPRGQDGWVIEFSRFSLQKKKKVMESIFLCHFFKLYHSLKYPDKNIHLVYNKGVKISNFYLSKVIIT